MHKLTCWFPLGCSEVLVHMASNLLHSRPEMGDDMKRRGFTLIELMIVIAIIAIIAAIAIPGLLSSQRASNERNASTSLKTITAAQADFRANDRDGNHVNDFWTADVKGLYTMTSAAVTGKSNS